MRLLLDMHIWIFYEVHEMTRTVSIVSVGHKEHNVLWVRGKEVQL